MKKILTSSIIAGMLLFSGCGETDTDDGITPRITLLGDLSIEILLGGQVPAQYLTPNQGYTAHDEQDGDLTSEVTVNSNINANQLGNYTITYSVIDSDGYTDREERNVTVVTQYSNNNHNNNNIGNSPTISVDSDVYLSVGETYAPTYTAYDTEDGDLTSRVSINQSELNIYSAGDYTVTFFVTDDDENTVSASQIVHVGNFTTPLGQFKTWYRDTCQGTFNDAQYNETTRAYNGTISCANQGLYTIDLSTLSVFSTINGLNLSGNDLTDIDFTQLDLLPNNTKILYSLDLRNNQLNTTNFSLFRPLFNLRDINELNIEGNNFNYTCDELYELRTSVFNNGTLRIDSEHNQNCPSIR
jgi:hypothetical protein